MDTTNTMISVFADGHIVPDVCTEEEAIKYLRLDMVSNNSSRSLKYLRDRHGLRGIKLGKRLLYSKWALQSLIKRLQEK